MLRQHGDYQIDDSTERIDFARVTQWLAGTYWSPGISREIVETAAENSAVLVGAYLRDEQVGYLRVISDKTSFAWVADVYVDEAHRRRGIALAMMRFVLEHPELTAPRKWMLGTRDAHAVYRAAGFGPLDKPDNAMIYRPKRAE